MGFEPVASALALQCSPSRAIKTSSKGQRFTERGYQAAWPRHGYQAVFYDVIGRAP